MRGVSVLLPLGLSLACAAGIATLDVYAEDGMTLEQITAILGPPTDTKSLGAGPPTATTGTPLPAKARKVCAARRLRFRRASWRWRWRSSACR